MKKPLLITIIVILLILALPFIYHLLWYFQEKKPIDIVILDKTVPTLERVNHKSLTWILTNGRFVKKDKGTSYSYRKDYYGFFPTRPLKDKGSKKREYQLGEMMDLPRKIDAIYFADTYGVFFNDWYAGVNKSRRSRKIYGGLTNTDYLLLNEMRNRNKLVILEYNTLDFPTAEFESFRTQEKLGITYTGWTGKYFEKLDSTSRDFPIWMTAMYRKEYNRPWTFTGPGVVLLSNKNIIVLEQETHLKNAMPFILTDSVNCEKYGVAPVVAFTNWFDIIDPIHNDVVSKFRLETNELGDSLLDDHMLRNEFPAVIVEPSNRRTYYFSGDFAANKINYCSSKFKDIDKFRIFLYSDKSNDPRRFYWLYYKPLMNSILNNYYSSLSQR